LNNKAFVLLKYIFRDAHKTIAYKIRGRSKPDLLENAYIDVYLANPCVKTKFFIGLVGGRIPIYKLTVKINLGV